jgi:F-type H+-transporting ATPase subunit delta
MANKKVLAKRAVKVLLHRLAGKTEQQVKFLEFLELLEELFRKDKTFRDFVLDDRIPLAEKEKFFEQFVSRLEIEDKELAKEFLLFLTKHHAFKYLPLIIRSYRYELENILGTVKAQVITAEELSEEIKTKIVEILKEKLNKNVEADFKVDPELIGGFVVKTTSVVVDASVKDLLRELAMKI